MLIKFILKRKNSSIFKWIHNNNTLSIVILAVFGLFMTLGFLVMIVMKLK